MIRAKNISFSYGDKSVIKNVDFYADKGEIISLIGPNGSGKSTLLRLLCKLLSPSEGSIEIMGESIGELKPKELPQRVAFLPQFHEKMNGVSVYDLISMGRAPYHKSGWINTVEDKNKIEWAIDYMNLSELRGSDVEKLSGGQRQRVWIAMILAQDTPIVMLDEPVTYMDMKYQYQLLNIAQNLKTSFNKTVISVFHDINHAIEISDRIFMLKDGCVYSHGDSSKVVTERNIGDVYDVRAYVCEIAQCERAVVVPLGICE